MRTLATEINVFHQSNRNHSFEKGALVNTVPVVDVLTALKRGMQANAAGGHLS
jgi:hypothetical protein